MTESQYQAEVERLDEEDAAAEEDYQYKLAEQEKRPESLKCQQAARNALKKLETLRLKRRDLERKHNLVKEEQEEKGKKNDEEAEEIFNGLQEHFGIDEYERLTATFGVAIHGRFPSEAWWGGAVFVNRTVLYSPAYREFYEYNESNGLWSPISDDKLTSQLHSLLVEMDMKVFKKTPITQYSNEKFKRPAIASQQGCMENKTAFIEKKAQHVQVQNGVLDFTDGVVTLKDFSPDYYSLFACPLAYDPKAKCYKFMKEMRHLRRDDRQALQLAAGQFLLGRNLTQKIFLFEGVGNSRKTTITNVIKLVIGGAAVTQLRTEHLNDRFEMYRIYQKSLLIGSDVQHDFLMKDGAEALKRLTGGDPLTAEGKNSNQGFNFDGDLNILVNSNSRLLLRLQTDADAWKRRLVLIFFPAAPESAQNNKANYWDTIFREEGAGVLNWMVRGANRLLRNIAEGKGFVLSSEQKKRVALRIDESDAVNIFLQARVTTGDSTDALTTNELLTAFKEFCASRKWGQPAAQTVSKRLAESMPQMFSAAESNNLPDPKKPMSPRVRGYTGVTWIRVNTNGSGSGDINLGRLREMAGKN